MDVRRKGRRNNDLKYLGNCVDLGNRLNSLGGKREQYCNRANQRMKCQRNLFVLFLIDFNALP